MKKTNAKKKLLPAIGMLAISAAMLSSATFAWFTMNRQVTLTGMEVKTHVGSNLLISADTLDSTSKKAEATFITDEEQLVSEILEPVSTANGVDFFYTLDAKADGSKLNTVSDDPYKSYATRKAVDGSTAAYTDGFSQDYGLTAEGADAIMTGKDAAVGYVDYVFQLKATNTEATAKNINLTKMDLTYNVAATDTVQKAFRAAVFVEDITDSAPTGNVGTLQGFYTPAGATNHNNQVVSGTAAYSTIGTGDGQVKYITASTPIASVAAGATKYYKVVVRLFIEGQDTTCTSATFAPLTDKWSLDLAYELDAGTSPVYNINMLPARS